MLVILKLPVFIPSRYTFAKDMNRPILSSSSTPEYDWFGRMPIELRQRIAGYLEHDEDIKSYRSVCRSTHDCIDQDSCSFWRRRFLEYFDQPLVPISNFQIKDLYQRRQELLYRPPNFNSGNSRREVACLSMLRDLIRESWSKPSRVQSQTDSNNIERLKVFALGASNILRIVFASPRQRGGSARADCPPRKTGALLITIQVVLAALLLHPQTPERNVFGFPASQTAAYATPSLRPMFPRSSGLTLDMEWVLHQVNFWKFHMLCPDECTLWHAFKSLSPEHLPQLWRKPVNLASSKSNVGRFWKYCFAFVDPDNLSEIRDGENGDEIIQDNFEFEGCENAFPELRLELVDRDIADWPPYFEKHLQSLGLHATRLTASGRRAKTRSGGETTEVGSCPDSMPLGFTLTHASDEWPELYAEGWLDMLPAQNGIPGFQRFTMMKIDRGTNPHSPSLWAYEGVMLPGGQMILGRWWSPVNNPDEFMDSGPFIMWGIDRAGGVQDEMPDELDDCTINSVF